MVGEEKDKLFEPNKILSENNMKTGSTAEKVNLYFLIHNINKILKNFYLKSQKRRKITLINKW